jgi:hypothetical protein
MHDWAHVFGSYVNSGVYNFPQIHKIGTIQKTAASGGLDFLQIDFQNVKAKAGFLKKLAHALNFPDYFGMNWDALSDCLTDLSWKPATGYVLLLKNLGIFMENAPEDWKIAKSILDSSANYWKEKAVPFYIILTDQSLSNTW